ncbi:LysR family transcriptional regulator [Brevibacterium salitolerans]|uniref:LysR family transcriptional regulator n=2 Tax=Brevibacterium salitolerans TaxID=1403566 RepID=A0ABN2WRG3_9MICO
MNLGMRHLTSVVALHRLRSFTLAAAEMGVSQPALSRTVAEAERRIGIRLFVRTSQGAVPTDAGTAVAERAATAVRAFEDAVGFASAYSAGSVGSVRLACLPSVAATVLPAVVAGFRDTYPDVQLVLEDGQQDTAMALVAEGGAELGLVAVDEALPAGIRAEVAIRDGFVAAVPSGHEYADRELLRWTDFQAQPFVAFDAITSIGPLVRRALAQQRVRVSEMVSAGSIAAVGGLVAAGMGMTAVPRLVVPLMQLSGIVIIPLEEQVERTLAVVHRAGIGLSPAAELFRGALLEHLRS